MSIRIVTDTPEEMRAVEDALDREFICTDEIDEADEPDSHDARLDALSLAVMSFRQPDSAAAMTPPDTATLIARAEEFHRWMTRS